MPVRRAVVFAAALAAPLALAVPPALAVPAPAPIAPPAPGTCWDTTYEFAIRSTYTGTMVDCSLPHTVETAVNLDVPTDVAAKGNASRDLMLWVDARCQMEVNTYAGIAKPETAAPGTRTWYFWYTPTQKQWKAGNHWVSCAAASVPVSMNGKPKLVPVSNSIAGTPDLSKPRTYKSDYGLGTYVARKVLTSMAGQSYPGSSGLQKTAWAFCKKEVGSNKYFWFGPSEKDWVEGRTAIQCYAKKG